MTGHREFVLRTVAGRGLRFVRLWFVDVLVRQPDGAAFGPDSRAALPAFSSRPPLTHAYALTMADAITTFRVAVKEAAHELGAYATFMPKPLEEHPGSGMHLHVSLFCGDRNAFHAPDADEPLSDTGRSFLAGVLALPAS